MWTEALVAAATIGVKSIGVQEYFVFEIWIGCGVATNELNEHKKTVSESETVTRQHPEKTTEMPEAKSGKMMVVKTFRSTRGSLSSGVPRFINKFFGWSTMQNYSIVTLGNSSAMLFFSAPLFSNFIIDLTD